MSLYCSPMIDDTHSPVRIQKKTEHAYTLIELLIIIMIMSVLFTIGFIGYRDYARRQIVAGVVKQIQGDLRLTQQMALSGQKPNEKGCADSTGLALDGVYFGITNNPQPLYRIRAVCGNDPTQTTYPILKEVNLPDGIRFDFTDVSYNPIVFKVLGQGTNIPVGITAVITIMQTGTDNVGTISVSSGGEIK